MTRILASTEPLPCTTTHRTPTAQDSQVSSSDVVDLDGLVGRMRDLATHNRHDTLRSSKRDKAALKTTFRGILETVEEGSVRPEKVRGNGGVRVRGAWRERHKAALRTTLRGIL